MNNTKKAVIALLLLAGMCLEVQAANMKILNRYGDKEVWITTYREGRQIESFCIGKYGEATKWNDLYRYGFKIRAEVMTGPACKGTKVCDTDIDMKAEGQPGYTNPGGGIYVQPHASGPNRCYIGGEVQVVHRMTVNNTYKDKYVWITSTEVGKLGGQGPQINSGCINPGQQRSWIDDRYRTTGRFVRAEVMTGADCKGNKVCDTKAEVEDREVTKPVFIRQNAKDPNNCYIDWK